MKWVVSGSAMLAFPAGLKDFGEALDPTVHVCKEVGALEARSSDSSKGCLDSSTIVLTHEMLQVVLHPSLWCHSKAAGLCYLCSGVLWLGRFFLDG